MEPQQSGNGSGRFTVHIEDKGGWARAYGDTSAHLPVDFPVYLSMSLTQWFRERPQLRMRCVAPIVHDGKTVELHAWFEIHAFPSLEPPREPQ
jgi:hypothetical protein